MAEMILKYWQGISGLLTLAVVVLIKFNDMKHLEKDVTTIKDTMGDIQRRQIDHESRISRVEGRLNGK